MMRAGVEAGAVDIRTTITRGHVAAAAAEAGADTTGDVSALTLLVTV